MNDNMGCAGNHRPDDQHLALTELGAMMTCQLEAILVG